MVRVLVSSVVGLGFEPQLCQAKDYRISICCIFVKHTALRSKETLVVWNQNIVSGWSDLSALGLLFQ
jgi:hypothetical protein